MKNILETHYLVPFTLLNFFKKDVFFQTLNENILTVIRNVLLPSSIISTFQQIDRINSPCYSPCISKNDWKNEQAKLLQWIWRRPRSVNKKRPADY